MICYCPNCQAEVTCTSEDRSLICDACQQSFVVAVPTLAPQETARLHRASGGWVRSLVTLGGILLAVWLASLILSPGYDRGRPPFRAGEDSTKAAVTNHLMATLKHPDFHTIQWHIGQQEPWSYGHLRPSGSLTTNPFAEILIGHPYTVVRVTVQAREKDYSGYGTRSMTFLVNNRTNKVFAAGEQPPAELIDSLANGDAAVDASASATGR